MLFSAWFFLENGYSDPIGFMFRSDWVYVQIRLGLCSDPIGFMFRSDRVYVLIRLDSCSLNSKLFKLCTLGNLGNLQTFLIQSCFLSGFSLWLFKELEIVLPHMDGSYETQSQLTGDRFVYTFISCYGPVSCWVLLNMLPVGPRGAVIYAYI